MHSETYLRIFQLTTFFEITYDIRSISIYLKGHSFILRMQYYIDHFFGFWITHLQLTFLLNRHLKVTVMLEEPPTNGPFCVEIKVFQQIFSKLYCTLDWTVSSSEGINFTHKNLKEDQFNCLHHATTLQHIFATAPFLAKKKMGKQVTF